MRYTSDCSFLFLLAHREGASPANGIRYCSIRFVCTIAQLHNFHFACTARCCSAHWLCCDTLLTSHQQDQVMLNAVVVAIPADAGDIIYFPLFHLSGFRVVRIDRLIAGCIAAPAPHARDHTIYVTSAPTQADRMHYTTHSMHITYRS